MDAHGRLTDENGNIVTTRQHHDLKINEKSVKDERTKDLERIMKFGKSTSGQNQARKKFYDQSLEQPQKNKVDRRRAGGL
jgi:hypothetical protein